MMSRLKVSKAVRGFFHRRHGLRAVVHPAQSLQVRIVEALHADGQPRHARRAEGLEAVFLERARVGLQRDLGIRVQPATSARTSPNRRSMASGENRLGVPPPMKTLWTCRPQISGSAASRSARSASR